MAHEGKSVNRLAASATTHCLTGCAIGEVLGFVIGTALGWGNLATIVIAIVLAFFFGYLLTSLPLLRSGLGLREVVPIALAADTASITIMEIVDNAVLLVYPGAMEAGLSDGLFWWSLALRARRRVARDISGEPLVDLPRARPRGRASPLGLTATSGALYPAVTPRSRATARRGPSGAPCDRRGRRGVPRRCSRSRSRRGS